jgi:hypothetical protein
MPVFADLIFTFRWLAGMVPWKICSLLDPQIWVK